MLLEHEKTTAFPDGYYAYSAERPLVSVVIPVYNVELFLCECLDSVIHQTYDRLEIILVDDGSTDTSGQISDRYAKADRRITVIHKENGGLGNARNVGQDIATGKYIIFLDSDDYWDLNAIEQLCETAEKDSLQVLVFAGEPFWDGMEQPELYQDYCHSIQNGIVKTGIESFKTAWESREYYSSPGLRFYLREYLVERGFRFDEGVIHEDISHSFLAYVYAERVECIGNRFYKRRFRPGSIMTTRSLRNSVQGYRAALETLLIDYNKGLTDQEREVFILQMCQLFYLIYNTYCAALAQEKTLFKGRSTSDSHLIAVSSRKTLRKARFLSPYLKGKHRIALYNLESGYIIRLLRNKVKAHKQNNKTSSGEG